jgi:nitrogen fixation protein NifX
MTEAPLSNDVALRIGLAAQILPGTSVPDLLEALHDVLGEPLDEKALTRITVSSLKEALRNSYDLDGEEDGDGAVNARDQDIAIFKEAVRILWGEAGYPGLPDVREYPDGELPSSVRVAVASNEGEKLDGHFGSCLRFLVYQVSAEEVRLVDIRPTLAAERSSDRNAFRVGLISDCHVLYTVSIGGPASAKVIKADIHISQHPNGGNALDVLEAMMKVIAGSPPPWLSKLVGAPRSSLRKYQ